MHGQVTFDSDVKFRAPGFFVTATEQAEQSSAMTLSEYCRAAIRERLERDGISLVAGDRPP